MLDENLSCLLDESDDEGVKKNGLKNKKEVSLSIKKTVGNEKKKVNFSSSVLNFSIRNIGNLDCFFKNTHNENGKGIITSHETANHRNCDGHRPNDNPSLCRDKNKQQSSNTVDQNYAHNRKEGDTDNQVNEKKFAQLKNKCNRNQVDNNKSHPNGDAYSQYSLNFTHLGKNIQNNELAKGAGTDTDFEVNAQVNAQVNAGLRSLSNLHKGKTANSCKPSKSNNHEMENEDKKTNPLFSEHVQIGEYEEDTTIATTCEKTKMHKVNLCKERLVACKMLNNDRIVEKHITNSDTRNPAYISINDGKENKSLYVKNDSILRDYVNHDLGEVPPHACGKHGKNTEIVEKGQKSKGGEFPRPQLGIMPKSLTFTISQQPFSTSERVPQKGNEVIPVNTISKQTEFQRKIKKSKYQKRKELIFCFSFIRYNSWVKALQILNLPLDAFHLSINAHKYMSTDPSKTTSFLHKCNIHNILNNRKFCNYRIERMMIIVKSIRCRSHGYFIIAMDPSGHMPASLHKEVEKEYKKSIDVGSTLILKDVTVFESIENFPYLIITLRSLVRVIKAEDTDYATREDIFRKIRLAKRLPSGSSQARNIHCQNTPAEQKRSVD
ncbi:conserved Plasmodium protein, unknown function [Plasmodium ovale wallikeri]|uniref:Homologous recombination OB-fold protein OB-fold domain-containing protein n=2 Tax=Plasmodium ovale TaxID=36330 RepID=A0A1A8Z3X2_PLAOA|nr:conserved Plasmodium protein, unknown function [Plasmodium ovale wallikeri]SBT39096.1 conserved Plasmodium protein, unknown function [Plasmodium ovale wallikeri]SBT77753.1 conserved Plasmodium protein, unknown function [Plasmodium ovale]